MEKKGLLYNIITRKKASFAIILILFILGGFCFKILPKQQFPIIQLPVVIITTVYPGATPTDMEELVTDKIEDVCKSADGFDNVKSDSYNGASVVKMMFSKELSDSELQDCIDSLRVDIEALRENELPDGITSMTFNDNAFETCGIVMAFTGDGKSNAELSQRAETLKDKILGTNGVVRADVEGDLEQQVKITVDTSKMDNLPISLTDLSGIISNQNSIIPVGTIKFDDNEIYINSSGKFESLDEIKNIIVYKDKNSGAAIKLRDIADIRMEEDNDSKKYNYNGKDAVILSVYFDDNVNITDSSDRVIDIIDNYKQQIPKDIEINKVVYLADDVSGSINDFIVNLIESVVIVLLIVMIGMNIRNGSIVAFVIPFTIFLTFIAMKLFSIDIQFVSLASLIIALGMLVDNAIVVSDSIQVRIDNGEEKLYACINGTKEVALPVFSSMLTTVAIFCVFYNLPGTMKRFIFSLPTIVISALVFSYLVSMLVTPLMCYVFMKKSKSQKTKRGKLEMIFSNALNWGLNHIIPVVIISIVCVIIGVALLKSRELQLMPYSDKMFLDINIETDNMNDIDNTEKEVKAVENIVKKEDAIEYYLASVGGRVPKYDFTTVASTDAKNSGSLVVKLKDTGNMTKGQYCKYIEDKIKNVTSANVTVKEIGIMPKASEEIQLNVCGSDIDSINKAAVEISDKLNQDSDVRDVYTDLKVKGYNYYVRLKNDLLNSSGLTKGVVQNELNIAMMGRTVTTYRLNSQEYPIVLNADVSSIDSLKNLQIKSTQNSSKHKLSSVADIGNISDYTKISHYNGEKCVTITALPKYKKSAVAIENRLMKDVGEKLDNDITIEYEGDSNTFIEVTTALRIGGVIGIIAIMLILYLQFYSIKRCFVIMLTVPFAIIGSSLGLVIFNENLSLFAILGIISLIGVVVNNAIVLVDYIDGELATGIPVKEACKTAVSKRFRPIMLSSTTTILGLVPLAFAGNILFKGLSIAFMCGLTISLVFTLVVIPVVYSAIIKKLPNKE